MLTPDTAVLTSICSSSSVLKSKRAMKAVLVCFPSFTTAVVSIVTLSKGREKRVRK